MKEKWIEKAYRRKYLGPRAVQKVLRLDIKSTVPKGNQEAWSHQWNAHQLCGVIFEQNKQKSQLKNSSKP